MWSVLLRGFKGNMQREAVDRRSGMDENREDFSEKLWLLLLFLLLLPSGCSSCCCFLRERRLGLSKPPASQAVRCRSLSLGACKRQRQRNWRCVPMGGGLHFRQTRESGGENGCRRGAMHVGVLHPTLPSSDDRHLPAAGRRGRLATSPDGGGGQGPPKPGSDLSRTEDITSEFTHPPFAQGRKGTRVKDDRGDENIPAWGLDVD